MNDEKTGTKVLTVGDKYCKLSRIGLGKTREEILEKVYTLAFEYEHKYGCCPQCILASIQDVFNIIDNEVFKSGHALAGGGGLAGDGTCGALSGGILALGSKYGRERKNFGRRNLKSYELAKRLHDKFIDEFGSVICHDVQKKIFGKSFNLWDDNGYKEFESARALEDKCADVAGKTAMWVAEMLLEEE